MYLSFFGLTRKPFELLPNPGFLFLSEVHKKAITYLQYGLMENTGFILFTGEIGTGKTTTIRRLLKEVTEDMTIATVFNTQVTTTQLLKMVNDDFGIVSLSNDKAELLRELNEFLIDEYAAGRRCVLIIDEAQNLGLEQLEEIRLLSNLETAHAKLLQIILVGQPELREKLASSELVQLRQRILVHCHLSPLNAEHVDAYIKHRLKQAGNADALVWQDGSIELVYQATRGVPRLINILCDYVLLDAFTKNQKYTTCEDIEGILSQLDFETQFWGSTAAKPVEEVVEEKIVYNAEWTPEKMDKLCDQVQKCSEMMHQNMVSLSQLIVLMSQKITEKSSSNMKPAGFSNNGLNNMKSTTYSNNTSSHVKPTSYSNNTSSNMKSSGQLSRGRFERTNKERVS